MQLENVRLRDCTRGTEMKKIKGRTKERDEKLKKQAQEHSANRAKRAAINARRKQDSGNRKWD